MLNKRKIKFIAYILSSLIIFTNSQTCHVVNSTDRIDESLYASIYRIPHSKIKPYANGGEEDGNPLSNAFDYNWDNYWGIWRSKRLNGENYTDGTEQIINFVNYVEFTFEQITTVDRVIYQPYYNQVGYPTVATFYYTDSENGEYILADKISSGFNRDKVMFTFSKPVTCKKLKFEFTEINGYAASASEIQIYQPESDDINQSQDLFTDYAETVVKKNLTLEYLNLINETCKKNINYDTLLYPTIKRAKKFLLGLSIFDPRKEFSTNPNAKNVIRRNGEHYSYSHNNLRMAFAGTNKQPTGIFGLTGEIITVYLSAKEGDKLPKVKFTQHQGLYSSYQSYDQDLKIGKNVFTFPNLINDGYSYKPMPGGPIYIVNPYTEDEQPNEVKVYIEGGYFFPFYIKGKSENDFYNKLSQYMLLMEKEPNTYMDLMELWGERVILTIDAKIGYNTYNNEKGPNYNLKVWDDYLKELYTFDGVKYDKNEQFYDKRNYYANLNVRHAQPYGAAYASDEHVGIFDDWLISATYSSNTGSFGWGFAHEVGHMMDIGERTVTETTNNMEAKYAECYLERDCSRGDYADNLLYLTPDGIDNSLRRGNNYYWTGGDNFLFWWQIETLFPGYWGKLDNMYRYNNTDVISGTEKQVYFSSIITGLNMSYYYERYGFFLGSEQRFTYSNATKTFTELMQKLRNDGTITNKIVKFWYLSGPTYLYNVDNNKADSSSCYKNNKTKINIITVFKANDGYSLSLPTSACQGHLGYEIYENDKVINFTYNTIFTDKIKYDDNYVPKYKIKAYDKLLECNDISNAKSAETISEVCFYNKKYYNSIADAIKEIPTGTTETYEIILKKNTYESQIEINANIIIKLSPTESNELKIIKQKEGYIFKVNSGKNLTLSGNSENVKLVVDGDNINQNGPLIEDYGILQTKYVKFINSIKNSQRGGAILSLEYSKLYIYDSLFENNKAEAGGAFCINSGDATGEFTNVTFRANTADYGGCLYNLGTLTLTNCIIENNIATKNGAGLANDFGGSMTIINSQILNNQANGNAGGMFTDGKVTLKNTIIKNNIASGIGGGIYESGSSDERVLTIEENTIISNNTANNGGGFYLNQGSAVFNSLSIYDNIANLGSNTYIMNGKLYIKSKNSKLEGEIYKNTDGNLFADSEIFSLQKENSPLILNTNTNSNEKEILLVKPNNYVITDNDLKLFSSPLGTLYLSDNNEIWVKINSINLIYKLGEKSTTIECSYGEIVTINYNVSEDKYVSKISDNNGKTYNIGDQITIKNSLTLTVEVKDLYVITLDFLEKKVKYYAKPNSDFYFPILNNKINDSLMITYWTDSDGNNNFDKVYITKNDTYFHANYDGYFYIKFTKENERLYYNLSEGNTTFVIPEFNINVPEGYDLIIECKGNKYNSSQTFFVNESMNFLVNIIEKGKNSTDDTDGKDGTDGTNSTGSTHTFLIVFSCVIVFFIIVIGVFFVYRFIRLNKDKNKTDLQEGDTLYELKE